MQSRHEADLLEAAKDGELWNLWYTSVGTPDGTLRDTVVFTIIASEWPTVKAHLRWLLDKPRG